MVTREGLRRDFFAFSDPSTELIVTDGQEDFDVKMTRDAEALRFTVNRTSGMVTLRSPTIRRFASVSALLSDSLFANIKTMIATQRQMNINFNDDDFINPEGSLRYSGDALFNMEIENLENSLNGKNLDSNKTRVILLDGPAGVGKTSLIQRILVRHARSSGMSPILHVINRGSRLFSLNQILAATIDNLRAKFTFDQAPALIRNGILIVAIDGFDELVDSEGYSDSWAALADFLNEIGGGGTIVLAGRDTFFDQQIFRERLDKIYNYIDLVSARLTPISVNRARDYLLTHGWSNSQLSSGPGADILREGSYALRPYFLRTLAESQEKEWVTLLGGKTIRSYLVESFIGREADIVRDRTSISKEVAIERLREVFSEIALEMAATETGTVDTSFVELVVEAVFYKDIAPIDLGRLKYKSGSLGFLETDEQNGYRRFPHTEVSNYFLSSGIIRGIGESMVRRVLRRASLETDFLSIFSESLADISEKDSAKFMKRLLKIVSEETFSQDRFQANLASLDLAALSLRHDKQRNIKDVLVLDAAIVGIASSAHLERVIINRFDVQGADLRQVDFHECTAHTLIADDETQFGVSRPEIIHIQIVKPSGIENLRGHAVREWLDSHALKEGESWSDAQDLLWRVIQTLRRRYAIRDSEDDPAGKLLRNPYWIEIEQILERQGRIVRDQSRRVSGPNDSFLRIRDPVGLLNVNSDESRKIWSEVSKVGR
jgi:hypothetical protein